MILCCYDITVIYGIYITRYRLYIALNMIRVIDVLNLEYNLAGIVPPRI